MIGPMQAMTMNLLRNRAGGELPDDERALIEASVVETRFISAGQVVVRQGQVVDISTLLVEGFMTRHIDASDGRRHLVAVHVAGDFVDLHAYPLKKLDHDVAALTNVRIAIVPHAALEHIQRLDQRLTRRLWFLTLLDAAIHRQWIYRLSSLSAQGRVAHFLCEMNARLMAIGASDGRTFSLPMTQVDIGEVCSLTNVHVSRVLRQLREQELCTVRGSQVEVHDLKRLTVAGQFNPDYLYLNPRLSAAAAGIPQEQP